MKVTRGSQLLPCILLMLNHFGKANGSQISEHPVLSPKSPNIDAISVLKAQEHHQDSMLDEAVRLLDLISISPSCYRVAATKLVASCQAFTDSKDDAETDGPESLDLLRSTYAARLALCEIDGAGTSIPTSCLPIIVSPPPQSNRFGFRKWHRGSDAASDSVPKDLLENCLRTLESRPQWWTSYSNSRQNALVICHASRIELEKSELLELYRSISKNNLKLKDGLEQALRDATVQSEQQQAFVQAVVALQEKAVAEIDTTDSLLKRTFGKFLREIESGIESFQDAIAVTLSNMRNGTFILEMDIRNASTQVSALQRSLHAAHSDAIAKREEALLVQETSAIASRELASSLHLSLESIIDSDMNKLYREMQRFDAAIEWLNSRMNMILEQENQITERFQHMETFMQRSEIKANELQMAQGQQAEVQQAIQFQAQVSEALLSKASVSAANLQSALDQATSKFKSSPGFNSGWYSTWSFCALLAAIAIQNIKTPIGLFILLSMHFIAIAWRFF